MTRRGRWRIIVAAALAFAGAAVAIAAWPEPEPPALFWVMYRSGAPGPGSEFRPGLHAAPGGPLIPGFEDWMVDGGCIEPRGVGPPESRAQELAWRYCQPIARMLEHRRVRFQATSIDVVGPSEATGANESWFVRLFDALPPAARPDPALAGTWDEKDFDDKRVTWRLDADGRCERSGDGKPTQTGRWGVLDGATLLLVDGEGATTARVPAPTWTPGHPAWRGERDAARHPPVTRAGRPA